MTLYQAWSPFLVALAYVVVEHGLLGVLDPVAVYGNPSAAAHPWRWALIHGGFILAASFGNILSWQLTEQESLRDSLTGLPNRARLLDVLNALLAGRGRITTSVLFLDLDGFKDLNDGYGHHAGDELLQALAGRLAGQLGPGQLLARLGGDEFAVVLEDTDGERALEVGERLLAAMASPFVREAVTATLSASIGVTCCDEQTRTAEDLLRQADLAMYASKRAGGGSVASYAPELQSAALSRFARGAELRIGLEQEQFLVYLQPILDVALNQVTCVEALVRWQHPTFGLLSPGEFIATAEQSGLIVPLGRWVLEHACQAVSLVNASRPDQAPLTVSVNLSPKQLTDPDLLSDIARALQRSGLPPSSLCLEITESTIIDQPDATIPVLEAIRALGIPFSLDNFGTGYSSLSYLKKLPVSTLKIDRSFDGPLLGRGEHTDRAGDHQPCSRPAPERHRRGRRVHRTAADPACHGLRQHPGLPAQPTLTPSRTQPASRPPTTPGLDPEPTTRRHPPAPAARAGVVGFIVVALAGIVAYENLQRTPRAGQQRPLGPPHHTACRVMAVLCAAAALIHLSVIREHLSESPWLGTFFIVLTAAQLTFSYLLTRRRLRHSAIAGIALASAGTAGPWLTSRLGGVALGPLVVEAERVGVLDTAESSLELLTALTAGYALCRRGNPEAGAGPVRPSEVSGRSTPLFRR